MASMVMGHPLVARSLVGARRCHGSPARRNLAHGSVGHAFVSVNTISRRVSPEAPTLLPRPTMRCMLAHLGAEKPAHLGTEKSRNP